MSHSHAGENETPLPIDPEHEVDGKKTAKYLVYWTVAFVVSIWFSYLVFDFVSEDELGRKVERAPTTELDKLRDQEKDELGTAATRPSLEDAIRKYVKK